MKKIKTTIERLFDSGAHNSLAVRLWSIIGMILGLLAVTFVAAMVMINLNTKKENTIRAKLKFRGRQFNFQITRNKI